MPQRPDKKLIEHSLNREGTFKKSKFQKWYEANERHEAHPWRSMLKNTVGKAAVLAAGLSIMGGTYNVQYNREVQENSQIMLDIKAEAINPDYNDHSIITFGGWGYIDGDATAKYTAPAIQQVVDGQIWSVDYNNAHLDIDQLTQVILDEADRQDVNTVTLVGRSVGGIIATQVAEQLANNPSLHTQAIIMVSTPDGYEGLRQDKQTWMNWSGVFDFAPDLAYSTPVRYLTELGFRSDRYVQDGWFNLTDFAATAFKTWGVINDNKLPGDWLRADQALAIQNAQLDDRLSTIGNTSPSALKPVIVYLGTAEPGYDTTINDKLSAENISEYAEASGLDFQAYYVPGAVHERPDLATQEYTETLQDASPHITQAIAREYSIYALRNLQIITPPGPSRGV